MKMFWGSMVVIGFLIAPSALDMPMEVCAPTLVFGVALMIFAGNKFCNLIQEKYNEK